MLYSVAPPARLDRGPRYMAQALAAIHAAAAGERFSLEAGRHADSVGLYFRTGRRLGRVFQKQLAAAYPDVSIARLDDDALAPPAGRIVCRRNLMLSPDWLALESSAAFEDRLSRELVDPLASLLGVLAAGHDALSRTRIIVELTPASSRRRLAARRMLDRYYSTTLSRHPRRGRWFLAGAKSPVRWRRLAAVAFSWCFASRPAAEVSNAYQKLEQTLFTARMILEASAQRDEGAPLGRVDFRQRREIAVLKTDDRRRHLYIVGKTGVGKSTVMLNMLAHDVQQGRGVGLIDPHGDLAADVLARVPSRRTNDVIWFDPASACVAFNPLECRSAAERPLVAAGVLTAMKKVFAVDEQHSPRLLYILRNVLLALVEQPQATLLDIPRMLADSRFRQQVVAKLEDEHVRTFWNDEFAQWNDRYRTEAVAPIQNKVGQFLSSPLLRAVFASPTSKLNLRRVLDEGQVLLVNLSHGRLGEDSAALLGALLVTSLQQAAMSRADMPEKDRRDFFLYADEFQTYAGTESLEVILSQARKYRLSICLANQLVGQMT